MQNLTPTNIGAFQKMKRMFQMAFHFSKRLVFFSPMIPIGGYHMKKKKRNENYAYVPNEFSGYDNHFN
jgi:hypothetical protein